MLEWVPKRPANWLLRRSKALLKVKHISGNIQDCLCEQWWKSPDGDEERRLCSADASWLKKGFGYYSNCFSIQANGCHTVMAVHKRTLWLYSPGTSFISTYLYFPWVLMFPLDVEQGWRRRALVWQRWVRKVFPSMCFSSNFKGLRFGWKLWTEES